MLFFPFFLLFLSSSSSPPFAFSTSIETLLLLLLCFSFDGLLLDITVGKELGTNVGATVGFSFGSIIMEGNNEVGNTESFTDGMLEGLSLGRTDG